MIRTYRRRAITISFMAAFFILSINRGIVWFFGGETSEDPKIVYEAGSPALEILRGFIGPFKVFPETWNIPTTFDDRTFSATPWSKIFGHVLGALCIWCLFLDYFVTVPEAIYRKGWGLSQSRWWEDESATGNAIACIIKVLKV